MSTQCAAAGKQLARAGCSAAMYGTALLWDRDYRISEETVPLFSGEKHAGHTVWAEEGRRRRGHRPRRDARMGGCRARGMRGSTQHTGGMPGRCAGKDKGAPCATRQDRALAQGGKPLNRSITSERPAARARGGLTGWKSTCCACGQARGAGLPLTEGERWQVALRDIPPGNAPAAIWVVASAAPSPPLPPRRPAGTSTG